MPEIVVVFIIALLVFGPKKLPELGRSAGKGIRDFKRALAGAEEEPVAMLTDSAKENV